MTTDVAVPVSLWDDISTHFSRKVKPCKDCLRGNTERCWHSECAAHAYRSIARRIAAIHVGAVRLPRHVAIENEIVDALARYGKPVYPSMLTLESTNSKAVKSATITRLVRQGRIAEERVNAYTRRIFLPTKTKQEQQ